MKLLLPIRKGLWIAGFILAANLAEAQIATLNFTVTQPSALVANAGADSILLCMDSTVAIGGAPSASGGTSPYTYAWTPTTDLSDPAIANPIASTNANTTYTLVVTDTNNCESSDAIVVTVDSCLTGITELEGLATFNLFPNPNNGMFEIQVSLLSSPTSAKISITSISGQVVFSKEFNHPSGMLNVPVNLLNMGKGIYVVNLDIDETRASRRVVLQ